MMVEFCLSVLASVIGSVLYAELKRRLVDSWFALDPLTHIVEVTVKTTLKGSVVMSAQNLITVTNETMQKSPQS